MGVTLLSHMSKKKSSLSSLSLSLQISSPNLSICVLVFSCFLISLLFYCICLSTSLSLTLSLSPYLPICILMSLISQSCSCFLSPTRILTFSCFCSPFLSLSLISAYLFHLYSHIFSTHNLTLTLSLPLCFICLCFSLFHSSFSLGVCYCLPLALV